LTWPDDRERQAPVRGGGLSGWERADLDRRFDRLSDHIYAERHDRQEGVRRHSIGGRPLMTVERRPGRSTGESDAQVNRASP
jgi:hypothetical protein